MDNKVYEWDVIKKKLNDGTFMKKIKKFDISKIKPQTLK